MNPQLNTYKIMAKSVIVKKNCKEMIEKKYDKFLGVKSSAQLSN